MAPLPAELVEADPIIRGEQERQRAAAEKAANRRPSPAADAPTDELLKALAWDENPAIWRRCVDRLCAVVNESRYRPAFEKLCEETWRTRNAVTADDLAVAYGGPLPPTAKDEPRYRWGHFQRRQRERVNGDAKP